VNEDYIAPTIYIYLTVQNMNEFVYLESSYFRT